MDRRFVWCGVKDRIDRFVRPVTVFGMAREISLVHLKHGRIDLFNLCCHDFRLVHTECKKFDIVAVQESLREHIG